MEESIFLFACITMGVVSALIANAKKRNIAGWFIGGFLFGILAVIVLAFLKEAEKNESES